MKFIESKCRMCGGRAIAKFEDRGLEPEEMEATQSAVDKWFPLLTCDPCYDAYDQRQRMGAAIMNACYTLAMTPPAKRTQTLKQSVRDVLENACEPYSRAVAHLFKGRWIYDKSVIDLLMDHPEKCAKILKEWRGQMRNAPLTTGAQ